MNASAGKKDSRNLSGTSQPRGGSAGDRGAVVLPYLSNPQDSSSPVRKQRQHSPAAGRTSSSLSLDGRESPEGPLSTSDKGALRTEGSLRSISSSSPPINNEVLLMSRKKQSLHLMRLVYKEVGEQLPKDRMTCGENLEKMRAEAVVGLLRHKSWWEFFKEASGQRPRPDGGACHEPHGLNSEDHPDTVLGLDAEETFRILKKRIVSIWRELRFPKSDTEYFLCHVMNACKYTMEQFGDMSAYLNALEDYRSATVAVMQAIRAREQAVAGLWSLLRPLSPAQADSTWMDDSTRSDLLTLIQEIQIQTVNCVNLILDWRRTLWRPLPFCYRGENYLIRIAESLTELTSPHYNNLLNALELQPAHLLCVTFPSPNASSSDQPSSGGGDVEEARSLGSIVPVDALRAADAVVAREPQVQAAIEAERKHLESRGKFIATLRFQLPSESQGLSNLNTQDSDRIQIRNDSNENNSNFPAHEARDQQQSGDVQESGSGESAAAETS